MPGSEQQAEVHPIAVADLVAPGLLDAQTLATQARINAVQALYDLHLAIVNLQYALGQPLVRRG